MLAPGDTAYLPVTLQTTAGVAAVYADKAALVAAGWTLTYFNNGVAVASPTWDLVIVASSAGRYQIALTLDNDPGQGECFLTPPAGYTCSVETFPIDVETYDLDGLYAALLTSQGSPVAQALSTTDLGQVVEGDIFDSGELVASQATLERYFGQSDLTGLELTASAMESPDGTAVDIDVAIVDAANRLFKVSWDTFPTDMELDTNQNSKVFRIEVRAATTGTGAIGPVTVFIGQVEIIWQTFAPAGP